MYSFDCRDAAAKPDNQSDSTRRIAGHRAIAPDRGRRQVLIAAVALAAIAGAVPNADAAPVFQGLGLYPGGIYSRAFGISADGSTIVGQVSNSQRGHQAAVWTADSGFTLLPDNHYLSTAHSVSHDGTRIIGVVQGSTAFQSRLGSFWERENGEYTQNTITRLFHAAEVSDDGRFIAGHDQKTGVFGYRWQSDDMWQILGDLPGGAYYAAPYDISGDGSVIVGTSQGDYRQAMRWTESGGMVGLGDLPGGTQDSQAFAVSGDGEVVVGISRTAAGMAGFRWTEADGMQLMGEASHVDELNYPQSITYSGDVVVGHSRSGTNETALLWTLDHGARNLKELLSVDYSLDLTGWDLKSIQDITPDGRVMVGYGVNPDGQTEAWMVSGLDLGVTGPIPGVPEPHTLAILGTGLVALGAGLGRRRSAQ